MREAGGNAVDKGGNAAPPIAADEITLTIDGVDEGTAQELQARARDYLEAQNAKALESARVQLRQAQIGLEQARNTTTQSGTSLNAAVRSAEEALQLHGGIGMTWEAPVHTRLKRAAADRLALGTPDRHRSDLAALVDLPVS